MKLRFRRLKKYDYVFFLHIIILFLYLWRSLFEFIGIYPFVYVFSLLLALINVVSFFGKPGKEHPRFTVLDLYLFLGFFIFLLSLVRKGFLISAMGLASCYMNLCIWRFSYLVIGQESFCAKYREKFIKVFLFAIVVNVVIGLYQYFIDASVFGLVSGIYGDELLLSGGTVTRRVVGFIGSPQVFSASCGVALFVASSLKDLKFRIVSLLLILIGGLLSGSRAFGLFLVIFLVYMMFKLGNGRRFIYIIFSILLLFVIGMFFGDFLVSNETFSRNFTFYRWSALNIYFSQFKDINWYEFLFGNGFGLPGWSASGSNLSYDYSSTESSMVSFLYQLGIVPIFLFVSFMITGIFKRKKHFCNFLFLAIFTNACFTPAFAGFSFSFIAWPFLLMAYNGFLENPNDAN